MRWKVLEYQGKLDNNNKETYGFKSLKCPPAVSELKNFENELLLMINKLEFRKVTNDFQEKLKEDINEIKTSDKIFVAADKSRHIYKMDKQQYTKLLTENVTKTYKKSNKSKINNINFTAKKITENLSVDDRVQKMEETEAYITVKDHKDEFPNKIPCRLINPSKSYLGKISKVILDKINQSIVTSTKINQWKNTKAVLDWFDGIENKKEVAFVQFDIESFYPSITKELLDKSIQYAKEITTLSDEEVNIIMQSRKTLLFHNQDPWIKRDGDEDFDVPMGCFDGAEICELTGSYLLYQLTNIIDKNSVGLYRDDGLGVLKNLSGPETERKKKAIVKLFKDCGLRITIQANLRIVNFLDVELNLDTSTYQPYRKPDNNPIYLDKNSNHPKTVLDQLPKSIAKRISDISSNESVFNKSIPLYQEALKKSAFKEKLCYTMYENAGDNNREEKKRRKRKIIWFNPPFSMNVKTNVGKTFLKLVRKHFPRGNPLNKIFNKNTLKVSYSCMGNIASIISSHNRNILNPDVSSEFGCNCRSRNECPLQNKCLTPKIVYRANVENDTNDEKKFYYGVAETPFKERFRNHKRDFNHVRYRNTTELSKYIWQLKDLNIIPIITWEIAAIVKSATKIDCCKLCLTEKLFIIKSIDNDQLLNKKSELVNTCLHRNKLLLKSLKRNRSRNDTMD